MEKFKCYQSLEHFESGKFRIFYSVEENMRSI